ncbi:restriction endonuclease subunit S [Alistipes sp. Z76]|nr:restriction endonuclease subunit S [Alistipes sp. Z76]NCE70164.1 restriction endonuclease subunit S [Muribaculaceae bacterium M3]
MDTQKLRQRILDLAIRGKLLPQDPNDEPASVLLDRIRAEKERLIAEGKLKRPKAKKSTDKSHYQNFTPPFDIPESWQWVRLGDYVINRDGERVPIASTIRSKQSNKIYDYYGAAGAIDKVDNYIFDERLLLIGEDGANLLSRTKDNAFFADGKYWVNNHAHVLDSSDKFLLEFVALYINTIPLDDYITGSAQPKLSQDNLNNIHLPIPPIEEQRRILTMIESLMSIICEIRESKQQLSQSIALTKSKILDLAMQGKLVPQDPADEPAAEMLRRVNPKAKIITDNPHYPQLPDNWVLTTIDSVCDYGYSENVNVDEIALSEWILELEDIEKDSGCVVAQRSKKDRTVNGVRHRFVKGDVLYSKLRTYLNKVLVAPTDGYCTTEIIPVKSYDCVIPEYLCAWLRSPFFLSYTAECCYGVKMPRLSTTDARKGIIPIPPINEQKRITQKLSKISELLSNLSISID